MEITIYSTPTCPYCKMAKSFLSENNIEFSDIDVSVDTKAAETMVEKSGQMGVPVIVIKKEGSEDEDVMVGFDKEKLAELVGITV